MHPAESLVTALVDGIERIGYRLVACLEGEEVVLWVVPEGDLPKTSEDLSKDGFWIRAVRVAPPAPAPAPALAPAPVPQEEYRLVFEMGGLRALVYFLREQRGLSLAEATALAKKMKIQWEVRDASFDS